MGTGERLTKSRSEGMIGGVCAGIGNYFDIDPTVVRLGYVALSFFSAFFPGIIVYIILMVIMPEN